MAANKQDDKSLEDDQAFIQSLYDDLSTSEQPNSAEQPSQQLDQSILAAAHQAVAAKPTLPVNDNADLQDEHKVTSLNSSKRKLPAWFYPMTMAASVLLVVSIVSLQPNAPMMPDFEAEMASADIVAEPERMQSAFAVADAPEMDSSIASNEVMLDSEMTLVAAVEVPAPTYESEFANPLLKPQSATKMENAAQETLAEEQMLAKRSMAKVKQAPADNNTLLKEQKPGTISSPLDLSYPQYKTLQAQSQQKTLYWVMQQETEKNYVIEVFMTEQTSHFYRLQKSDFTIKDNSKDNSKEQQSPFTEISYTAQPTQE